MSKCSKGDKIRAAADWIIKQAAQEGIVVMRYDAYSSDSVYLKFDDGVLGSLRISDHKGKKHLKYKYNLTLGSPLKIEDDRGFTRVYAPFNEIELLWTKIVHDRDNLVSRYGTLYEQYMQNNRENADRTKGFWKSAQYVQKELFINYEKI